MDLGGRLDRWLERTNFPPAGESLRCGVSGGADSLALMALAVASQCRVTAVHVDHGQRPGGHREADLVARCANEVGAEFESARVAVEAGSNLEARMRAARYGVLGSEAATGHTMDDQAETVVINLMRGAGMRGLGAMQPGFRRPVLGLRRRDTEEICEELGWVPFEDPTNRDPRFVRNRVRREALPLLCDISGRDVVPLLARSAQHAREASEALEVAACGIDPTDAHQLSAAPLALAATAIQTWIQRSCDATHPIDAASIQRVIDVAHGDAIAAEVVGGIRVSRSKQRLTLSGDGVDGT